MRVITGTAKGRKLKSPDSSLKIRPTADYTKESVFNRVQFDIEGRRVLDLFAGSGQLGIEALSRGAAFADFVDHSAAAIALVRQNLEICKFSDNFSVTKSDALDFLKRTPQKFDLIFLDPPYETDLIEKAAEIIKNRELLRAGGKIVCESRGKEIRIYGDLSGQF